MNQDDLTTVLTEHGKWLRADGGSCANLSDANLRYANLSGANLSDANLRDAQMPGFAGKLPSSIKEAAMATRDWLAGHRWLQSCWIKTPNGAYSGDCQACLHGAAVYVGGPEFGPLLSKRLVELGYTVEWNDRQGRTLDEVLAALDAVAK